MTERYNIVPPFGDSSLLDTKWAADVDFEYDVDNLTAEDIVFARNIIQENREKGFTDIMNELSRAGFRGKIVGRLQLNLPTLVMINHRIELK